MWPGRCAKPHCLVIGEVAARTTAAFISSHAFVDAIAAAVRRTSVKFQRTSPPRSRRWASPGGSQFSRQDASRYDHREAEGMVHRVPVEGPRARNMRRQRVCGSSARLSRSRPSTCSLAWGSPPVLGSGEVGDSAVFERQGTGLPLLISTGMSPLAEIDTAAALVESRGRSVAVPQCTTAYSVPPRGRCRSEHDFLLPRPLRPPGWARTIRGRFTQPGGGHLGRDPTRSYVTLSREMFGPDGPPPDHRRPPPAGGRSVSSRPCGPAYADGDRMARGGRALRAFTKSVVAGVDLPAGCRPPGVGSQDQEAQQGILAPRLAMELVGRCLRGRSSPTLDSEDTSNSRNAAKFCVVLVDRANYVAGSSRS